MLLKKQTHGERRSYIAGCRCAECREAQRVAVQKYRDRHREKYNNYMKIYRSRNSSPSPSSD